MKKGTRVLTIIIAAILSLTVVFVPADTHAASKKVKKMTVYHDVIVKGNYAYCGVRGGLYKVNLKKKTSKCIVNTVTYDIDNMRYHKGYIYFITDEPPILYRVKASKNKRVKRENYRLSMLTSRYAISGGKLYYRTYDPRDSRRDVTMVAKLNGKKPKRSKHRVKNTNKKSNKKGYKTVMTSYKRERVCDEGYVYYRYYYKNYLVIPGGGKILLGTYVDDGDLEW